MAVKVPVFGQDPADEAVAGFLRRKGIDPRHVLSYELKRSSSQSVIILELLYDSEPDPASPAPDFTLPRVTTENPRIYR